MTRILITGSGGLLGSVLAPYLERHGQEVWRHGRTGNFDVTADLTDELQTGRVLDAVSPDVVVNLAALTNVDDCERCPQRAYQANVRIVENLTRSIRQAKASCHLVQLSTDQVYDRTGPHNEEDVNLTNYYGFSKYAGELASLAVSSTVIRTNFFGPSRSPSRVSFSDWAIDALTKRKPITVFQDVRFSPLSLKSLMSLLELVIMTQPRGIFNLGSKEAMSKAEFVLTLAEVLELPTTGVTQGASTDAKLCAYRPKDMSMNSTLFEKTFNVVLPSLKQEIESLRYTDEAK